MDKTAAFSDKAREELEGNSSMMLDDVFFIVKKCIQRSISCQSIDGVCAVVNNANSVLETDLCSLLQVPYKIIDSPTFRKFAHLKFHVLFAL